MPIDRMSLPPLSRSDPFSDAVMAAIKMDKVTLQSSPPQSLVASGMVGSRLEESPDSLATSMSSSQSGASLSSIESLPLPSPTIGRGAGIRISAALERANRAAANLKPGQQLNIAAFAQPFKGLKSGLRFSRDMGNGNKAKITSLNLANVNTGYLDKSTYIETLPTPLHNPPTPLSHPGALSPSSKDQSVKHPALQALQLTRGDGSKDIPSPFALQANQPKDYIGYSLDISADGHATIKAPKSAFASSTSSHMSVDDNRDDRTLRPIAEGDSVDSSSTTPTPSTPPVPVLEKHPLPASARYMEERGLLPEFAEQYDMLDELGSGGFGFVIRARRRRDGLIVAVKFIMRNKVQSNGWIAVPGWNKLPNGEKDPEKTVVPLEAYILRRIRHPGVVAFLDLLEDDHAFYLVMEHHGTPWLVPEQPAGRISSGPASLEATSYSDSSSSPTSASGGSDSGSSVASNGPPTPNLAASLAPPRPAPMLRRSSCDLFECIERHSRLPEDQAKFVFAQIVDVVNYLASYGIYHRDIKDENIVVDKNFRVKLIDFGSAIFYDTRMPPPFHMRFYGTINFACSEILAGQPYRAPEAEAWSLGVLLSILLTGETPFSSHDQALRGQISKLKAPISKSAYNLLAGCVRVDPEERLTLAEIKQHPWLASAFLRD